MTKTIKELIKETEKEVHFEIRGWTRSETVVFQTREEMEDYITKNNLKGEKYGLKSSLRMYLVGDNFLQSC